MSKNKKREIPNWNLPIIETHCHLDYLKQDSLENILAKSREVGVEKIITIAVEPENLNSVLELARAHENIYCTQGLHPHEGKLYTDEVEALILENLKDSNVVAVGEIGLDFHYNNSPEKEQKDAFERQLQIACDYNKPIVVHTREADEDTKAILKNFSNSLKRKGVIHSFTSSTWLAEFCLEEGFSIGFNGIITFNSAQNVRDVLSITPLERILVETDAPFLTPIPFRGRENAPFYLPFIIEKIAEVKDCSIEQVLEKTYFNSKNLFDI